MALYIKNREVDALAERLAALKQMNKTEVVRLALQHELEREHGGSPLIEIGVAFCRRLRARAHPAVGQSSDKAFIDSLYEAE